jgi:Uma2 family endonuclease
MVRQVSSHPAILPTMYDLPSEEVGDSGLPDEFHRLQADLLDQTCRSPLYGTNQLFIASDLNLYYDPGHPNRYKRPDWFLALGVPRATVQQQLRWSYLVWQEAVPPLLVIELLSPGTEAEDLGETVRSVDQPPRKWDVYEQFLQVPYYGVCDRYQNRFRMFRLEQGQNWEGRYGELKLSEARMWLPELGLGLGVWEGIYKGISGLWLRWYNQENQWVPTESEQTAQECEEKEEQRQRADQAERQYQELLQRLQTQGIDIASLD